MKTLARITDRLLHAPRRQADLDILWPALKEQARTVAQARAAFTAHALQDPAWLALGRDELMVRMEALR
jgi:hypothetical protein